MDFLPIFMNLRGQRCLLVGGGEVAARKGSLLTEAGARVRMVSPTLADESRELLERAGVEHLAREFVDADLDHVCLVIAATDDRRVNARVANGARQRSIPVNVVDDPELCSFVIRTRAV